MANVEYHDERRLCMWVRRPFCKQQAHKYLAKERCSVRKRHTSRIIYSGIVRYVGERDN